MNRLPLATAAYVAALLLNGCGGDTSSPAAVTAQTAPTTPAATPASPATPASAPLDPPAALIPPAGATNPPAPTRAAYAGCMNTGIALSYEEQRLVNTLPGVSTPFADQILAASGFDRFGPNFATQLCTDGAIKSFADAVRTVKIAGETLWNAAVDRVQGRKVSGTLPQSDDRMLYWARLKMTQALRQWVPQATLTSLERAQLQWVLERASRGQYALQFPAGPGVRRIVISGFDPFTLGTPGAARASTNIRIGNPSGAIALALANRRIALADGSTAVIQTYLLPVNYNPFRKGMQEHTLAPFFIGNERVDASITMSQGGPGAFWIENWHGRYHAAAFADNLGTTIGDPFGDPMLPAMQDADIYPPDDVLGYDPQPWQRDQPAQYTTTTLPVASIIAGNSGAAVTVPGASKPGGYGVIWHTNHSDFADCGTASVTSFNDDTETQPYPPTSAPVPPAATSCAYEGGGGNYLSNESGYRNTLLRDTLNPQRSIFAGHLHVPVMTYFSNGDNAKLTDSLFESYRDTIVQQASRIVTTIAGAIR
ncbi:hypothetical protein [Burkholderia alba]|uniref:hypothetical protein n=1 Tax=Burkholderia alba TaxID=2683677 RepID=UPI002B059974|nr:hypothetical protein [Burkholderia alba]